STVALEMTLQIAEFHFDRGFSGCPSWQAAERDLLQAAVAAARLSRPSSLPSLTVRSWNFGAVVDAPVAAEFDDRGELTWHRKSLTQKRNYRSYHRYYRLVSIERAGQLLVGAGGFDGSRS